MKTTSKNSLAAVLKRVLQAQKTGRHNHEFLVIHCQFLNPSQIEPNARLIEGKWPSSPGISFQLTGSIYSFAGNIPETVIESIFYVGL